MRLGRKKRINSFFLLSTFTIFVNMDKGKKILAVINPISGTDRKNYIPDMLNRQFEDAGFNIEIRFTRYANHAFALAKEAAQKNYYGVLAVGGDGTVNEVASALCRTDTALGIIPNGSGNGLARHLHIPLNIEDAISVVKEEHIESLDYCTANDLPFFCTCGIGFDAQVSEKFAKSGTRGPIGYVKSALSEYLKYRSQSYKITTPDGIISEKAFIIACGNASQYGNNAYIAPNANIQDGLIDITVILPITPFDTAILGLLLFSGHIDQDTNITSFRTPSLKIEREKAGVIHIDGESVMMPREIDIECHPLGLKAFVPTKPSEKSKVLTMLENGFWDFVKSIKSELEI